MALWLREALLLNLQAEHAQVQASVRSSRWESYGKSYKDETRAVAYLGSMELLQLRCFLLEGKGRDQ